MSEIPVRTATERAARLIRRATREDIQVDVRYHPAPWNDLAIGLARLSHGVLPRWAACRVSDAALATVGAYVSFNNQRSWEFVPAVPRRHAIREDATRCPGQR